jgi:hypothetical protein
LDELQQGPAPERHVKLTHIIKAGITNLGGSAATINLSAVERASFSAIPFVEAVQDPSAAISIDSFLALCKQLGHIHLALTHATGVSFEAEAAAGAAEPAANAVSSHELRAALHQLQQGQAQAGISSRHLVQAVIAQIDGLIKSGVGQCDVTSLREALERPAEAEKAFLHVVQRQLPALVEGIATLRAVHGATGQPGDLATPLVEQVAQLWSAAQQVNAAPAVAFLTGLHSFLMVVLQQRVVVATKRFEAIEMCLRLMAERVQAWVQAGQEERVAIGQVLLSQQ